MLYGTGIYLESTDVKARKVMYKVRIYPKKYKPSYVNYNRRYTTFSTEYLVAREYRKRAKERFLTRPT